MRRRWIREYEAPLEFLTTQACAIGLLCIVAGLITGAIGAFAYALVKGLKLQ
jgi:hypothetical protein